MFSSLTIKIVLLLIGLGLVAGEQYWVYSKGYVVGQAEYVAKGQELLNQALKDQEEAFRSLRKKEMREAAEFTAKERKNDTKLIGDLKKANETLKLRREDEIIASTPLPVTLVELLNSPDTGTTAGASKTVSTGVNG